MLVNDIYVRAQNIKPAREGLPWWSNVLDILGGPLHVSTTEAMGSIPVPGTRIAHAAQRGQGKKSRE